MIIIAKSDWNRVHEIACDIANAAVAEDDILIDSKQEALMCILDELELKYGPCSRITATRADYTDSNPKPLYQEALRQARKEGDSENEQMIIESLSELESDQTEN